MLNVKRNWLRTFDFQYIYKFSEKSVLSLVTFK